MDGVAGIAEEIRAGVPELVAAWREERGGAVGEAGEEPLSRLTESLGRLLVAFTEFLSSPSSVAEFSRQGATRALIREIAGHQREAGRDAVGVTEDYAALRRQVWRFVDERADLSAFDGGEVSRFFAKLLEAADWATETGLEAFEEVARREREGALDRAEATDLLTGLPDRDLFNRRLLPRAIKEHASAALLIFDVADFSGTVAAGEVARAREALLRLAGTIEAAAPGDAVRARFGDDEICVVLPDAGVEAAYRLAEETLERLAEEPGELEVDVGVAGYPEHGANAEELVSAAMGALNTAKRVGGSGIVAAR